MFRFKVSFYVDVEDMSYDDAEEWCWDWMIIDAPGGERLTPDMVEHVHVEEERTP